MQNAHEAKLAQMESERQSSLTNEKFLEEKCRTLQEEKDRTEDNARKRISQMTEEFATKLREGREKLQASEEKRKRKEEDELRKMSELEKLNALIEQKLQLTENELSDFKTRLDNKERDLKELNKELHASRKEIQGLNQKLYEAQNKKKEELQEMRETYEKRITEMQTNLSVSQQDEGEKAQQWQRERETLQNQLTFATMQLEENRKMHETLVMALNKNVAAGGGGNQVTSQKEMEEEEEKNRELRETNKKLTITIERMENRCIALEAKVDRLKRFQRMVKGSASLQCKVRSYCNSCSCATRAFLLKFSAPTWRHAPRKATTIYPPSTICNSKWCRSQLTCRWRIPTDPSMSTQ